MCTYETIYIGRELYIYIFGSGLWASILVLDLDLEKLKIDTEHYSMHGFEREKGDLLFSFSEGLRRFVLIEKTDLKGSFEVFFTLVLFMTRHGFF